MLIIRHCLLQSLWTLSQQYDPVISKGGVGGVSRGSIPGPQLLHQEDPVDFSGGWCVPEASGSS